jgi:ribosomal protein S18 acetylase RimI-like enzyme
MAARWEAPLTELVGLSELGPQDLDPLLSEEIGVWEKRFAWDFRPAADLLRRFLHIRSLAGCALRVSGEVAGYAYSVCEGRKGLIGDLYVREKYSNPVFGTQLLQGVSQGLMRTPGIRRIESQLMLLNLPAATPLPFPQQASRHDRLYLQISREAILQLPEIAPAIQTAFVPWSERQAEEAAHVLAASYRGHIDSEINDQYRSIPGARLFLSNITRYPGCGRFAPECSVLCVDGTTSRVCGMALTSFIAAQSGHITQICVLPAMRQARLGYELMRRSLGMLVEGGCTTVSLTVTCANVEAIRLYESIGFVRKTTFPALVWDRL